MKRGQVLFWVKIGPVPIFILSGIISTTSAVKELFLVDGSADINTGYSMEADRVEPYG
jgi:hypothetical protein